MGGKQEHVLGGDELVTGGDNMRIQGVMQVKQLLMEKLIATRKGPHKSNYVTLKPDTCKQAVLWVVPCCRGWRMGVLSFLSSIPKGTQGLRGSFSLIPTPPNMSFPSDAFG